LQSSISLSRRAGSQKRSRVVVDPLMILTPSQGLPVIEGPHFVLGTASLSILAYDPDHPKVPVIALWNAFSHDMQELLA